MKIKFTDAAKIGQVKKTSDGYMTALARVARSGIQEYRGYEVGLVDRDIVRIYRPAEEVFSRDSLQSYSHAPITIDHPADLVDAANWHDLAVGEVSTEAIRDGEHLALPLMIKDQRALDAIEGGKVELSAGYTAEVVMDAGVTPSGEPYDGKQVNIKINHVALVDRARAGERARIGDSSQNQWGAAPITQPKDIKTMADTKTLVVGDEAVNLALSDHATIKNFIDGLKAEIAQRDETIGQLKAECADTAAKVMDADQIEALVQTRLSVIDKARTLIDGYDATGKSVEQIRREAVAQVHGDEAAGDDVTDAEIKGIFDFATTKKPNDKARAALSDAKAATSKADWGSIIKMKD